MTGSVWWSIVSLVFILCTAPVWSVSVMSVDLGTEWMKVAIVSPGVPMEIALNKESKRKTPVAIAFRDGERTFGEDALTVGVRFPKLCYTHFLELLGKKIDHPLVQVFKKRFPYYDIVASPDRGTVVFQHDSETQFTPEELLAMLLQKAREFAQNSAIEKINDAVIIVPGYFNQAERRAVLQAAELSGLKVLQLMNDYTAVALNYGIFRRKDFNETAQYVMFYDMGASSTTATVVSFQLVKTKEKGVVESNPQLSVIGVGYDRTLGGLEKQMRLRDHLGKKFNEMKKTPNDVFQNPRAMAKLFKEAGRVKNVLSANVDHFAQIEGLLDDKDFKVQVTREEFEKMCEDLFERVKAPIDQALKTSGLSMDLISQVILVGAGTRVPKVQEKLTEKVAMELSKNLNTDEAAVMGAVYRAADLSNGFKVKKFLTKDAVLFPIQVIFDREADGGVKQVKRMLFGQMNPYPQKKILTFNKYQTDFTFHVNYAELDYLNPSEIQSVGQLNLSQVDLSGVAEAHELHKGAANAESKGIKAHFTLDESGVLALSSVELVIEKTLSDEEAAGEESPFSKLGSTISKLFSGPEDALKNNLDEKPVKEEPETGKAGESGEKKDQSEGEEVKQSSEEQQAKEKPTEEQKKNATGKDGEKKKPKVVTVKEAIKFSEKLIGINPLAEKEMQESLKKITSLDEHDARKRAREGAMNALESAVIDAKVKLEEDAYNQAATQQESEAILALCAKIFDWLDEEGYSAEAADFESRLAELKQLTAPVWRRVKEHEERPDALAGLESTLSHSNNFLATIKNMTANQTEADETPIFTAVEISLLQKTISDTQEWKSKMIEEQSKLKSSDNPKLTIASIVEKINNVEREVKYLVNKIKIWRPKKKESPKDTKNTTSSTDQKAKKDGSGKDKSKEEEKVIEPSEEVNEEEESPNAAESGQGTKTKAQQPEPEAQEPIAEAEVPEVAEPVVEPSKTESELRKDSESEPSIVASALIVFVIHVLFRLVT
ncbi:hypoxia up-regulated protein 1 isoform X4 [Nilaparvata lugens]|uniref:hypoxia up-regulated protein 1 isoform X4 n=1 Tax=Nilaparvata lugens TaxID=108931 RepID=UPI00193E572E|nr:hypoxia up-regulated protein 1 isoform X4 [Nilaparvata lugens]XP_039293805.1 hypoxia up-regulated protein 1 isoform X4 [Nilaparvata lugens]XP_039293807.1 hypoxia up-regulated protein 1 isoform X4 [Nilaparvata lugens]